jgi:hypothetical protein
VVQDDIAYLARLPRGPIVVLDGAAALIWTELVSAPDLNALVDQVRARLSDVPDDLAALVGAFVADLIARGWVASDSAVTA